MVEYFVLNDASLPFSSKDDADSFFPTFISIMDAGFKFKLKAILLSEQLSNNWFDINLAEEYSFRAWLGNQEREYRRKVRSLISRTNSPIISKQDNDNLSRFEYSEFTLAEDESVNVSALGATYLLRQQAISLLSKGWCKLEKIRIKHKELFGNSIKDGVVTVSNVATFEQWLQSKKQLLEERKISVQQGKTLLWDNRERDFPNLIFFGDAPKQLQNLQLSKVVFAQLWTTLVKLSDYCESNGTYSLMDITEKTGLTASDESETVKNNPKLRRYREVTLEGQKIFVGYHTKNFSGAMRLYFYPNSTEKSIYISYFGKHLPTKK